MHLTERIATLSEPARFDAKTEAPITYGLALLAVVAGVVTGLVTDKKEGEFSFPQAGTNATLALGALFVGLKNLAGQRNLDMRYSHAVFKTQMAQLSSEINDAAEGLGEAVKKDNPGER